MRAPMPCRQKCARQRNHRRHVKFIFCYFPANLFKVFENNTKSLFLQRLNFETESETYFQIKCTQKSRQICYFTSFCAKVQITWGKQREEILASIWRENSNHALLFNFQTLPVPPYPLV